MQRMQQDGKASTQEAAGQTLSCPAPVEWPRTAMPALPVDNADFWSYSPAHPRGATTETHTPAEPIVAIPMRPARRGHYRAALLFMDGGPGRRTIQ